MKAPEKKPKKAKQVSDMVKNTSQVRDLQESSLDEIIAIKPNGSRSNSSSNEKTVRSRMDKINFLDMEVPIYKLQTSSCSFKATLSDNQDAFFAEGSLIGTFYTIDGRVDIKKVRFIGSFKGVVEYGTLASEDIYFEGLITQFLIIRNFQEQSDEDDRNDVLQELQHNQTSFTGFFKGRFYQWSQIPNLNKQSLSPKKMFKISRTLSLNENIQKQNSNEFVIDQKIQPSKKLSKMEYFLPTVVRYEIQNVGQINLKKSSAVIRGILFIEIHYNDDVKRLIEETKQILKNERKNAKGKMQKYKNLLKIELNFHRDNNIQLDLEENDDDDDDVESQGSEWSIVNKTWDTVFEDDEENKILKFKIWNKLNAEIDNSYGAFFAPFNLSVLRIVMTLHHMVILDGKDKVKVHLIGIDMRDYDPQVSYDPYKPFNDLQLHKNSEDRTFGCHINRIRKINRFQCNDSGSFIIADNRLRLFPYFRNVLMNTYVMNEDIKWTLGTRDKISLFQSPKVRSVSDSFHYYEKEEHLEQKVQNFKFQKWSYIMIEIPVYKYLAIDMIQVFVPLILLTVIGLLVFSSENGVFNGEYNILAYRLVNVGSLMVAFVSLIPVIRQSMPPMPGLTLIELITYACVAPNLLAIIASLVEFNVDTQTWLLTYSVWRDAFFNVSFGITILALIFLGLLVVIYMLKEYTMKNDFNLPAPENRKDLIKYRSPCYLRFMEEVKYFRKECKLEVSE